MSWLLFAFSGPIFWALSTHIDKYLVEKYFKDSDVGALLIFTSLIGLLLLPFVWAYNPGVLHLPLASILVMALSGILYMLAMFFYLKALQTEEASIVAPFFQTAPLFGYVLAYLVLHETLTHLQLVGGLLVVGGTLLIAVRPGSHPGRGINSRLVLLMLTAALFIALSSVIFKFFAVHEEFWTTVFWTYVGEALFGLVLLAIPLYRRELAGMLAVNRKAVLTVNGANELINLGGNLGVRYALLFAPLSIVQAISSTTPLLIFGFGVLITLFLPRFGEEDLSRKNLLEKGFSAALVVAGVILINV